MSSVVVGMFDTQTEASQARSKLITEGFTERAVMIAGNAPSASTSTSAMPTGSDQRESEGAISQFFRSLFGSDENVDRHVEGAAYEEAFRRGAYCVSVTTADNDEVDKAERILDDVGAFDIDERSDQWRQEGWAAGTGPLMHGSTADEDFLKSGSTRKLQEIEEELQVGKRSVVRGGVRVFRHVTEVPVEETVHLREEHAKVQRHAVDRPATEADLAGLKDDSIEIREMTEEAVVSKSARVVGEVEIGKEVTERDETVRDTVRKTKVDVENFESDARTAALPTTFTKGERDVGEVEINRQTTERGDMIDDTTTHTHQGIKPPQGSPKSR